MTEEEKEREPGVELAEATQNTSVAQQHIHKKSRAQKRHTFQIKDNC